MSNINTNPSIYIARVFSNITWKQVKDIFEEIFGKGTIGRVDVVKRRFSESDDGKFNMVYVHFRHWPEEFHELRDKLVSGDTVKLVYDEQWFWTVILNKNPRKENTNQRNKRAPYVAHEMTAEPGSPSKLRRGQKQVHVEAPTPNNSFAALADSSGVGGEQGATPDPE